MKLSPLLLLVVPTAVINAQDNDMACATAAEDADCVTCLTEGCVQAVDQCMSSCSFIADASCWDMQYHANKTVEEVCNEKAVKEADEQVCGGEAAQNDCGTCTSTAMTAGGNCEWYSIAGSDLEWCGTGGCDMSGTCGSTTCESGGDTNTTVVEGGDSDACNGFDDCEPCLNSRMVCAWIGDSCQRSCDVIADAACYDPSSFPNMTGPEICKIADESQEEVMDDSDACNGFDDCEPCLNSRMVCAWIGDSCQRSCDVIADAACYDPSSFPNMTGPDICKIADAVEEVTNDHPCHGFDSCGPCLNSRIECAWVGGGCEPTCDSVPDAAVCYHPGQEVFQGMVGPEICAAAVMEGAVVTVERGVGGADPQPLESSSAGTIMRIGSALSVGWVAVALL